MINKLSSEFIKFLIVGIFATIINYASFSILYKFTPINYLLSSSIGFLAGVFAGFPFNKQWTFKSNKNSIKLIIPYLTVYTISLILSLILLEIQVKIAGINPYIANFICICFTTVTNFAGTKILIFKN